MVFRMRVFIGLITCLAVLTEGLQDECSSLMTYRQFTEFLSESPACYRNGCGATPASSMSSMCPASAPCHVLWDFMFDAYQNNWCSNCRNDIACRIPGWPILSATSVCNAIPHDWLYDTDGRCCIASSEPFDIAQWISKLCNGSEWRKPFNYYAGMAKDDWAEWMEPWNWTFRYKTPAGSPPQVDNIPQCAPPATVLSILWIENLAEIGAIVLDVLAFWVLTVRPWRRRWDWPAILCGPDEGREFGRPGSGILNAVFGIVASVVAAVSAHNTPGYSDLPIADQFLLHCTRPTMNGLNFFALRIFPTLIEESVKRSDPEKLNHQRISESRTRTTNIIIGVAYAEAIQQFLGLISLARVANAGRSKGFFIPGALLPYWRGEFTLTMYAGALLSTILSPVFFLSLVIFILVWEDERDHKRKEQIQLHLRKELRNPQSPLFRRHMQMMQREGLEMARQGDPNRRGWKALQILRDGVTWLRVRLRIGKLPQGFNSRILLDHIKYGRTLREELNAHAALLQAAMTPIEPMNTTVAPDSMDTITNYPKPGALNVPGYHTEATDVAGIATRMRVLLLSERLR